MILAFYGDDFTGSTDALEQLAQAGWRARLLLGMPDAETLADCRDLDAVGLAGVSRSLSPEAMEAELRPAFTALRSLAPLHVHYKVCSTFDSSPHTGSIGRAIDIGAGVFPGAWIPLVVGAPSLGRYCAFGNLFARMGIGSAGQILRLDRHPSMRHHPVTPADESDLRLHLGKQTRRKTGLVDLLDLARPAPEIHAKIDALCAEGCEVILFDALDEAHIETIGGILESFATGDQPLFSVGSSSIERALAARAAGTLAAPAAASRPDRPVLVLSGSRSPVTSGQIRHALRHGFGGHALDVPQALDPASRDGAVAAAVRAALEHLRGGRHALVHTAALSEPARPAAGSAMILGQALGRIALEVIGADGPRRVVVAGGDTSGHAVRVLGIDSVEMAASLWPGAPLCRAQARRAELDGMELVLKGGQVGDERFFLLAAGEETATASIPAS